MSQARLLRQALLRPQHRPTGFTQHTLHGQPIPPVRRLQIVQYPRDAGYYLLYCDEAGHVWTDTYHDSMAAALAQAQAEFGILPTEWE